MRKRRILCGVTSNRPETVEAGEALRAMLDEFRGDLGRIPGCTGNWVGLTQAAFMRLRTEGVGPGAVTPQDIVIAVGFESEQALDAGRSLVDELLGDAPHECRVTGRIVLSSGCLATNGLP